MSIFSKNNKFERKVCERKFNREENLQARKKVLVIVDIFMNSFPPDRNFKTIFT